MQTPRYDGLKSASTKASAAARGSSQKSNTKPELMLRRALWRAGLHYRKNVTGLPGKPDIVFKGARLVVFCDGDFWHGKDWKARKKKLLRGTNPSYWVAKIERNMQRDRLHTHALRKEGWAVLRFWESDIKADVNVVVAQVMDTLGKNRNSLWKEDEAPSTGY